MSSGGSFADAIKDLEDAVAEGAEPLAELSLQTLYNELCVPTVTGRARVSVVSPALKALAAFRGSLGIQIAACSALGAAAVDSDARKKAGAKAVDAGLAALKRRPASERASEAGLLALTNLVLDPANLKKALKEGAVDAVVGAIKAFPSDALVCKQAAIALGNLSAANPAVAARAAQLGGVDAVVAALKDHRSGGAELCRALAMLVADPVHCARAGVGRTTLTGAPCPRCHT